MGSNGININQSSSGAGGGFKEGFKRQHRPEIHFTGPSLASQIGSKDFMRRLKSESEIPDFLKINEKGADGLLSSE